MPISIQMYSFIYGEKYLEKHAAYCFFYAVIMVPGFPK